MATSLPGVKGYEQLENKSPNESKESTDGFLNVSSSSDTETILLSRRRSVRQPSRSAISTTITSVQPIVEVNEMQKKEDIHAQPENNASTVIVHDTDGTTATILEKKLIEMPPDELSETIVHTSQKNKTVEIHGIEPQVLLSPIEVEKLAHPSSDQFLSERKEESDDKSLLNQDSTNDEREDQLQFLNVTCDPKNELESTLHNQQSVDSTIEAQLAHITLPDDAECIYCANSIVNVLECHQVKAKNSLDLWHKACWEHCKKSDKLFIPPASEGRKMSSASFAKNANNLNRIDNVAEVIDLNKDNLHRSEHSSAPGLRRMSSPMNGKLLLNKNFNGHSYSFSKESNTKFSQNNSNYQEALKRRISSPVQNINNFDPKSQTLVNDVRATINNGRIFYDKDSYIANDPSSNLSNKSRHRQDTDMSLKDAKDKTIKSQGLKPVKHIKEAAMEALATVKAALEEARLKDVEEMNKLQYAEPSNKDSLNSLSSHISLLDLDSDSNSPSQFTKRKEKDSPSLQNCQSQSSLAHSSCEPNPSQKFQNPPSPALSISSLRKSQYQSSTNLDKSEISLICLKCGLEIASGSYMTSAAPQNGVYHMECFTCAQCNNYLGTHYFCIDDKTFTDKNAKSISVGSLCCNQCYAELQNSICAICRCSLLANDKMDNVEFVEWEGNKLCINNYDNRSNVSKNGCFSCANCGASLIGVNF